MLTDLVFPKNNEEEFIKIAEKLRYDAIYFAYSFRAAEQSIQKLRDINKPTKIRLFSAIYANYNEIKKSKKYGSIVIVKGSEKNREVLEKTEADMLFDMESEKRKDFMHHRASGLNHILCKIANNNRKMIGFSFNSILNSNNKLQILGRISQNIRLCRKYKVKTFIGSFAQNPYEMSNPYDLVSLFVVLGMHPKEAKDSLILNNYKK